MRSRLLAVARTSIRFRACFFLGGDMIQDVPRRCSPTKKTRPGDAKSLNLARLRASHRQH
eukprot:8340796-Pyramimonas_sp.AAC.1